MTANWSEEQTDQFNQALTVDMMYMRLDHE